MPSLLTKKERAAVRQLKSRIVVANKALEDALAKENIRACAEARREIRSAQKDMKRIRENAAGRKSERQDNQSELVLARIREEFPPVNLGGASPIDWAKKLSGQNSENPVSVTPRLTMAEIEKSRAQIQERLNTLSSNPRFNAARAYLIEQANLLKDMLRELQEEEVEAKRQEKAEQDNRDFLAAESDIAPLREKLNARLNAGPLPLDIRENTHKAFLDLATKNRERAKEAGNALQEHSELGMIHPRAVFNARADWYETSAKQLEIFQWNLNQEPPLTTLDKDFFDSGLATSPSNLNFRTLDEKALIVYVARRYFTATGNHVLLNQLPDWPEPIRIPAKPHIPLEELQRIEQQRCLEALQPLHFDRINETIYSVPTATLTNPHSKPLLLWPDGRECQINKEIIFDRKSNGWRRMPEPAGLEADWNTRFEWEQNEYGDFVKVPVSNGRRTEWTQDATGHFVPETSIPNGQWRRMPLLKVVEGDHKPGPDSPRQYFAHGHWWEKSDLDRANQAALNIRILTMPQQQRTIADQIATERNLSTPLSQEESVSPWRRWESKQKLNEEKHV